MKVMFLLKICFNELIKMEKLKRLMKGNYLLIIVIVVFIITTINIYWDIKKRVDNNSTISKELKDEMASKELLQEINIEKSEKESIIFTKPINSCGKCLITVLNKLLNDNQIKYSKPYIIMEMNDKNFIAALYTVGILDKVNLVTKSKLVKELETYSGEGLCLILNKEGRIIYSEEINSVNIDTVKKYFL